jgi:hypothetical protein
MYTQDGATPKFDSVMILEGSFAYKGVTDPDPHLVLTATYVDSKTGFTFGKLDARSIFFTPKTVEAFKAFLNAAETDIGTVVMGSGTLAPFGESQAPRNQAESDKGPQLPPGLGQEESPTGWEEG